MENDLPEAIEKVDAFQIQNIMDRVLDQQRGERVNALISGSLAKASIAAYRGDWSRWLAWCFHFDPPLNPLPAKVDSILGYLAETKHALSTIRRTLLAVSKAHKMKEKADPTRSPEVIACLRGLTRERRNVGVKKASPIWQAQLKLIVDSLTFPPFLRDVRNRAMILLGWAGALRASEISGLNLMDLETDDHGLILNIRWSKTDQAGQGRIIGIPYAEDQKYCPVRAVFAWITVATLRQLDLFTHNENGALFREVAGSAALPTVGSRLSTRSITSLVKTLCAAAGLEGSYSAHSLRSGFCSAAAQGGASTWAIQAHTGHKSVRVLAGYVRRGNVFEDHPGKGLL